MIDFMIRTLLADFSLVMLVAAFVMAGGQTWLSPDTDRGFAHVLFGWLLLLSLGLQGVYTFIVHVFFPAWSAEHIGWAVSPFQYEVGIADLTVGVLGILGFWSSFGFRLAAATAGIVWYWGDAIGHVRQMIVANNYAPGNAGSWFWTDVIVPLLLLLCLRVVWKQERAAGRT